MLAVRLVNQVVDLSINKLVYHVLLAFQYIGNKEQNAIQLVLVVPLVLLAATLIDALVAQHLAWIAHLLLCAQSVTHCQVLHYFTTKHVYLNVRQDLHLFLQVVKEFVKLAKVHVQHVLMDCQQSVNRVQMALFNSFLAANVLHRVLLVQVLIWLLKSVLDVR